MQRVQLKKGREIQIPFFIYFHRKNREIRQITNCIFIFEIGQYGDFFCLSLNQGTTELIL